VQYLSNAPFTVPLTTGSVESALRYDYAFLNDEAFRAKRGITKQAAFTLLHTFPAIEAAITK
jgi:hypothetical protein